ncbi:hypothetical protein M8312_04585 [Sphingomonas sp. KRR8]|uniref:hypothetical protein n=1 Tax=Sphingomonas sp. KRR8 TaxID=2942996 RepID=UPI0020201F2B|nr:hypothetical protein [Sphingomonas sp. KRR8]URD61795.1 hypothetical protein M8312_04585 [Sphingomonas sp. KRR8]
MRLLVPLLAAGLTLSGCVQTQQYADLQFAPPKGNYKLIVLRPEVEVGAVTTGGMVEPRADWTEQARSNVIAALRTQQEGRGGQTLILDRRDSLPTVPAEQVAELERLNAAVDQSIALHKYSGVTLPSKRRRGLDYTLGQDAVRFGQRTGYDYALFLHAEDSFASQGRVALQVLGIAGCFIGFCAPNVGGAGQFAYASLVDLRTGEVVWFNVLQAGSQVAGVKMGDLRTPDGAAQMVERLLGRMKPGRDVRRAQAAQRATP